MKLKVNLFREKDEFKNYLTQINWDWWFLKGQLILASIFLTGLLLYVLLYKN